MRKREPMRERGARWALAAALGVALAGGTAPAAAQDPVADRISISESARRALERYPSIGADVASAEAARAEARKAEAERLPNLNLNATATRFEEPMLVAPLHGFDPDQPPLFDEDLLHGTVAASYTLFDGGARGARIRRSRSRAEAASAAAEMTRDRVLADLVRQYTQVLAAAEVVEAHDVELAALESEVGRAQQQLDVGRAAQVHVLRAEAALAQGRAARIRAATTLEVAERALAALMGQPDVELRAGQLEPVGPPGEVPLSRDDLVETALEASPEVRRLEWEAAAADAGVRLARSAYLPEIRLIGQIDNRGTPDDPMYSQEWSVGGALSYPLFDGGARGSEVSRAKSERTAAEERLELARFRVRGEVDRALAAYREARGRVGSLASAVEHFREVARAEKLALDVGAGTQTDYLAAEADLRIAAADLAQARMDVIAARAELARATGEFGLSWLETHLVEER